MLDTQETASSVSELKCPGTVRWAGWIMVVRSAVLATLFFLAYSSGGPMASMSSLFVALEVLTIVAAIMMMVGKMWAYITVIVLAVIGFVFYYLVVHEPLISTMSLAAFILMVIGNRQYNEFSKA
jgi:hypothetical protein